MNTNCTENIIYIYYPWELISLVLSWWMLHLLFRLFTPSHMEYNLSVHHAEVFHLFNVRLVPKYLIQISLILWKSTVFMVWILCRQISFFKIILGKVHFFLSLSRTWIGNVFLYIWIFATAQLIVIFIMLMGCMLKWNWNVTWMYVQCHSPFFIELSLISGLSLVDNCDVCDMETPNSFYSSAYTHIRYGALAKCVRK